MIDNPLISVALCTYNGERFIETQLSSILNQTYSNIEVIVVDDCSRDRTMDIVLEHADRDPRVKAFVNSTNLGFNKNFEQALSRCNGDFIAISDQDDIWKADKLELQIKSIGSNQLIYHDSELIDENGFPLEKRISHFKRFYRGDNPLVFLFNNCVSGHSILMTKELRNEALPFPEGVFYDCWLAYVATNIGSIDFLPETLVKYRQHSNNITTIGLPQAVLGEDGRKIHPLVPFLSFKKNKHPSYLESLHRTMTSYHTGTISFARLFLILRWFPSLFYIMPKSSLSKLNRAVKYLWKS